MHSHHLDQPCMHGSLCVCAQSPALRAVALAPQGAQPLSLRQPANASAGLDSLRLDEAAMARLVQAALAAAGGTPGRGPLDAFSLQGPFPGLEASGSGAVITLLSAVLLPNSTGDSHWGKLTANRLLQAC